MQLAKRPQNSNTGLDQRNLKTVSRPGAAGSSTKHHVRSADNWPPSSDSAQAASGLILGAPGSSARLRSISGAVNTSAVCVASRADRQQVPDFKPGNLVEVIDAFTSDEKVLLKGKIGGAQLSRGQRGKIASMDNTGDAYISFPDIGKTLFVRRPQLTKLKFAALRPQLTSVNPADESI